LLAVGVVDLGLEVEEGRLGGVFGSVVAGDGYVDYAAGGYGGGKEDGGEFDLEKVLVGSLGVKVHGMGEQTRRLSSVNRTATPASTLPTVRDMSIVTRIITGTWELRVGLI